MRVQRVDERGARRPPLGARNAQRAARHPRLLDEPRRRLARLRARLRSGRAPARARARAPPLARTCACAASATRATEEPRQPPPQLRRHIDRAHRAALCARLPPQSVRVDALLIEHARLG
eukprot:scaffold1730_cov68-Phaeocystis_antarctica.AAC.4